MSRLTIIIDTNNDAFQPDPSEEVARILKKLATNIAITGIVEGSECVLRDTNGNSCGSHYYSED